MFWRKPKGEGAANRLSDEAEPNMLTGTRTAASKPSWTRATRSTTRSTKTRTTQRSRPGGRPSLRPSSSVRPRSSG